ncbi:hypothetical protein H6G64_03520 [Calothrix sp. FACHB-156]|nr:hypothetical protein [Calothrix sp. FACHB-156]
MTKLPNFTHNTISFRNKQTKYRLPGDIGCNCQRSRPVPFSLKSFHRQEYRGKVRFLEVLQVDFYIPGPALSIDQLK